MLLHNLFPVSSVSFQNPAYVNVGSSALALLSSEFWCLISSLVTGNDDGNSIINGATNIRKAPTIMHPSHQAPTHAGLSSSIPYVESFKENLMFKKHEQGSAVYYRPNHIIRKLFTFRLISRTNKYLQTKVANDVPNCWTSNTCRKTKAQCHRTIPLISIVI